MHKATFLEGTLHLTIEPAGPILVKAGESGGADPTLPDMEFVRTRFGGATSKGRVYIPGASLKGVVRAQAERIARSLDRERRDPAREDPPLADNPLGDGVKYSGLDDMRYSSGRYIESIREDIREYPERTAIVYRRSSLVSQVFGHTSLAGRVRFADAYTEDAELEERNGVAIDRIYGSVAVGPFNYETVVAGQFETRIDFKNLTLAQLGLLGLALRDLAEGRIGLGFGKSRGLGRVHVTFDQLMLYYPACALGDDGTLRRLNDSPVAPPGHIAGLGALCDEATYGDYRLPRDDSAPLPEGLAFTPDELLGVRLIAEGDAQVRAIWKACMPAWKRVIGL